MKINIEWILDRLQEPSTWKGIIGIFTILGVKFAPEQVNAIIGGAVALISVIEIVRTEKLKQKNEVNTSKTDNKIRKTK